MYRRSGANDYCFFSFFICCVEDSGQASFADKIEKTGRNVIGTHKELTQRVIAMKVPIYYSILAKSGFALFLFFFKKFVPIEPMMFDSNISVAW